MAKEVYFDIYCKKCLHWEVNEGEEPCNTCLAYPANEGFSHKPLYYEENKA